MNWQEILIILAPLLGLMAWVYSRIEKKADERQASTERHLDRIVDTLHNVNNRLTRLEGRFDERGYWESREHHKTGTDIK